MHGGAECAARAAGRRCLDRTNNRKSPRKFREPPSGHTAQNCVPPGVERGKPPQVGDRAAHAIPAVEAMYACARNSGHSIAVVIVRPSQIYPKITYLDEMCRVMCMHTDNTPRAEHYIPKAHLIDTAPLWGTIAFTIGAVAPGIDTVRSCAARVGFGGPASLATEVLLHVFVGLGVPVLQRPILGYYSIYRCQPSQKKTYRVCVPCRWMHQYNYSIVQRLVLLSFESLVI